MGLGVNNSFRDAPLPFRTHEGPGVQNRFGDALLPARTYARLGGQNRFGEALLPVHTGIYAGLGVQRHVSIMSLYMQ